VAPPSDSDRPPNRELVVFVLYQLRGGEKFVHTEDIAKKCHELFRDAFSWKKYPDFPDKDIVRVALTDARKVRYGALVANREQHSERQGEASTAPINEHWTLTEAGIVWVQANRPRLESLGDSMTTKAHRQDLLKHLRRIRESKLFGRFKSVGEAFAPSIGEMAELLRCRVDAEPQVWADRFKVIERRAQQALQSDVIEFVGICRRAYLEGR
jgi:hypothetical protein